jgi:CubicO group peptidase (beta-lactamase class C family)
MVSCSLNQAAPITPRSASVLPRVFVLALVLMAHALAVPVSPAGALLAQSDPLEGLDDYIDSAMRDWEVPGLAIAVVKDDSVVFTRGYGVTELGGDEAVDAHTLFAIASTTKAFTTAALAMLVDEERLDWDDRVTRHLPGFELQDPYVTRALTVRDLLTHRVGVARHDNLWIAAPFDRAEILRRARHLPTVAGFRDRYGYNNIMFIAAGEVVGEVAGTSWDDFLEARIFEPLGMARTTSRYAVVEGRDNVAGSHTRVDGEVQHVPRRDYDNIGGAGAIFSSVHDLTRWVRLHLGGGEFEGRRLLSERAVRDLHAPQVVIPRDSVAERMFPDTHLQAYALGWRVQDYHGRKLVHHSGNINYTRTQVSMVPEEGLGVVAVANLSTSNLQLALTLRVLDAYLGQPARDWSAEYLELAERDQSGDSERELDEARMADSPPSLPLEAYAGRYDNEIFGEIRIDEESVGLVLSYSPEYVADLEHWHDDVFRAMWRRPGAGDAFVTFTIDARARVPSLDLAGLGEFRRRAADDEG